MIRGASQLLVRSASGAGLFERPTSSRLVDEKLWSSRLLEATGLGNPSSKRIPAQALRLRLIDAAALAGLSQAALEMAVVTPPCASNSAARSAASRR